MRVFASRIPFPGARQCLHSAFFILPFLVVLGCGIVAWRQVGFWKNSETLFAHALAVTADNAAARHQLGHALVLRSRHEEAIAHFAEAARIEPHYPEAHCAWGSALELQGKLDEALARYIEAARLEPADADAHFHWGRVLVLQGKLEEAQTRLLEALRLKPGYVEARCKLGNLLLLRGELDEAISEYRKTLQVNPRYAEGHYYLAGALARQNRMNEAVMHLETALRLQPDYPAAANDLAWIRATETNTTIRNVDEAIRLAAQACVGTTNREAMYLDTLGVALAEAGRFAEAMQATEQAVSRALAAGDTNLAARVQSRLEQYRAGRSWNQLRREPGK